MDRSLAKLRTRWAAIGAAVAVTLGAGGIGIVNATVSSGERTVYVPINPCRMTDTRSGTDNVGPRATPLGAGEEYVIQARGSQGNCNLPPGATGIVANVTAVNATLPTNLRLLPTGGTPPLVSNLNPRPGAAPTPNAVTTDLDPAGQFSIVNFRGTVDVIIDIAGYYEDHDHDDRYHTKAEIDTRYPRVQSISVGSAAFTSRHSDVDWVKTAGDGGAYVNGGFGLVDGLVAPVQLPDGATISAVEVGYRDSSLFEDLTFTLFCDFVSATSLETVATFTSAGTGDWTLSSLALDADPAVHVVDNDTCSYAVSATNGNWTTVKDLLIVKGFVITVTLPTLDVPT